MRLATTGSGEHVFLFTTPAELRGIAERMEGGVRETALHVKAIDVDEHLLVTFVQDDEPDLFKCAWCHGTFDVQMRKGTNLCSNCRYVIDMNDILSGIPD